VQWSEWSLDIPGRASTVILGDTVRSGDIFFIVGESGVGKSSFALNLLGVNNQSSVMADGVEITPERRTSWFKSVGWVPQNPALAAGDVAHQFRTLSSTISDTQIEQALSRCGLEINDLPFGLATPIGSSGEAGSSASGGQIRKIALARSLITNPRVLIADEPTADLDDKSSKLVMSELRNYAATGAIVICITHDRSVLQAGDVIARFEKSVKA